VFGCGGERDAGKRPAMGAAAQLADHVVLSDDNPRGEDPARIVAAIRGGLDPHADVTIEHDRRAAIAWALSRAQPDDVVLIAGRGHETVQLVGSERRPFNDRDVVMQLIGGAA
jgi:UDP-N-acetylmuramoyl-L-alanyl-D-glutamate--2,6-diaminopimelate ligase